MNEDIFSFSPKLLVSSPSLLDPNFFRSLVLVFKHDTDGALGLVVNRRTQYPAKEVTKSLKIQWASNEQKMIGVGGPVEPQSLWFLHSSEDMFDESVAIGDALAVSRSENALRVLCRRDDPYLSLFVGYSGWGPGQLENEIRDGDWMLTELDIPLIFGTAPESQWIGAFDKIGVNPAHLISVGGLIQ